MSMFRLAWIDKPPSPGKVPDGKSNTEARLREALVGKFPDSKIVFVLIRHQASKSVTFVKLPDKKSFKRPAGKLYRITATAYTTRDNKYDGPVEQPQAVHLWVPDKHAKEIASKQEMGEYRQECAKENDGDDGPPENPEFWEADKDFKKIFNKLKAKIEDEQVPEEFFA